MYLLMLIMIFFYNNKVDYNVQEPGHLIFYREFDSVNIDNLLSVQQQIIIYLSWKWRLISANSHILSILFHPRLAVSKDSPSFIFNGRGVRFPESLSMVHLASQGQCSLPLQALDNEQVNRSNSHFQNLE